MFNEADTFCQDLKPDAVRVVRRQGSALIVGDDSVDSAYSLSVLSRSSLSFSRNGSEES